MAILIGSNDATAYTQDTQNFDTGDAWVRSYTASSSGSITTLAVAHKLFNSGGSIKLLIFSNTGTLLGSTPAVNTASGGWASGTLTTPVSVTATTTYLLGFVRDAVGGATYTPATHASATSGMYWSDAGGSYSYTTPTNITPATISLPQFQMYGDGTVASSGQPTGSRYKGIPGMNLISSRFGRGW